MIQTAAALFAAIACAGTRGESRVDALLAKMTLEEKVGQLVQIHTQGEFDGIASSDSSRAKLDEKLVAVLRRGGAGTLIGACGAKRRNAFQKIAVEETRLGIPILVGHDIIHGTTTVLPIPLGLSATWDADVWRAGAELIGLESRLKGVDWTFNPMLDVARDARWGRIAECPGQDPYLGALYAAAMVKGYQGADMSDGFHIAACAKHYVGYGAASGGRDYYFVEMTDDTLRDVYLPAFKAAVDAGVATIMPAFHSFNGVPCSGNRYLLTTILRDEWKWPGMTISDWGAVGEMDTGHTVAKGKAEASAKALMAGMDVDMMSRYYEDGLPAALRQGLISETRLNDAVRHVLQLKENLGLFDRPYVDESAVTARLAATDSAALAREAAVKSLVLLKNEDVLPLAKGKKVAVLGELAANAKEMLGTWQTWDVTNERTTLLAGLKAASVSFTYASCYTLTGKVDVAAVRTACAAADVVIGTFGEYREMNGEAKSRSTIELPGEQRLAFETMVASGKPVVAVLFNGRPLAVPYMKEQAAAVLEAWNPGNEAGVALADVLTGTREPYGRLTVDFPNCTGECPKFYNRPLTGRPYHPDNMWTSRYIDCPDASVWPFGYGLSYTTFAYANEKVVREGDAFVFTADITNTGARPGSEVVQVYVRDLVSRRVRPRRELKGFQRVEIAPGETKAVRIVVPVASLGYHVDGRYLVEPGDFEAWIAPDSDRGKTLTFAL